MGRTRLFYLMGFYVACSGDVRPLEPFSATVEVDAYIPNVAQVTWETNDATEVRVSVMGDDGEVLRSTRWRDDLAGVHQVGVVGLESDSEVVLRAEMRDIDGNIRVATPVSLSIPPIPVGFPEVVLSDENIDDDGLVLTHIISSTDNMVVIFDRQGQPVWYTIPESTDRILSVSLSEDGRSIWFAQHPTNYVDTAGIVTHMAIDGSFYNTYEIERVHSGAAPLPNGGFGFLKKMDDELEEGILLWDEIWEVDADGVEHRVFSIRDHFDVEHFCQHWEMFSTDDIDGQLYIDWTHANSLILSEDGNFWYLMVRHFDGFLKVSRETGEVEWVLGGPYSSFAPTGPGTELSHPHFSTIQDGSALIFDNGSHYGPPTSRLVQLDFNEDTGEVSRIRDIRAPDGIFVDQLGDAIWTPEGHMMGSWTTMGLIEEYDQDLQPYWSLALELGFYSGRIVWVDTLEP